MRDVACYTLWQYVNSDVHFTVKGSCRWNWWLSRCYSFGTYHTSTLVLIHLCVLYWQWHENSLLDDNDIKVWRFFLVQIILCRCDSLLRLMHNFVWHSLTKIANNHLFIKNLVYSIIYAGWCVQNNNNKKNPKRKLYIFKFLSIHL